MSFKDRLMDEMKQAMKSKDTVKLGTIRFLMSEIKNAEIDEGELTDEQMEKIAARQIKQMREVISEYERGGRSDLAEQDQAKIDVLETFLPKQMSDDELSAIVAEVAAETEEKNMGQIIGKVKARVGSQADGGRIAAFVKEEII